ncbi:hypothetical protein RUM44_002512 [Polyplax serrata]|uniref:Biogenesis of lysosome-related organelles complex 1 subunit 5 n=1 Tax=Polyplax serrata TaxID=468196 RepID=A0ABR1AF01_POLSC
MANVIKDIGEIWTRLFDHRPFINGEIKFFLQEFEEKRGDKEVERLFETLQNLTEIRYTQLDRIKLQGETNLETLKKQVDESTSMLNRILEREGSYKENSDLQTNRELRKAELDSFIKESIQRCEKVDELFDEEEKKIHEYFNDLEKQLYSLPSHSSNFL